jgi:adhesin transport system outer membrane protein
MTRYKFAYFSVCFLVWVMIIPSSANAAPKTLLHSVEHALDHNPEIKAQIYNYEAAGHDLRRVRGRYLPSLDLSLGQGMEQYSDRTTRQPGADPSDTSWDYRSDAALVLTQKVYDGGETRNDVSIRKAIQDSAHFRVQEVTQRVALGTISVHLNVCKQRELVALAEKDLEVHQDILGALSEITQAGAGNVADVTQTQARMAQAQSTLFFAKAELSRAVAGYWRLVGGAPGELAFADVPKRMMPDTLEEALLLAEQKNPELLAIGAQVEAADAQVALSRSAYKPNINIELSSRYNDGLEGDNSWQNSNDAMLVMRWNLFRGGQDKETERASLAKKYESRSTRDAKLIELREAMSASWAAFRSLQDQKHVYQDAVDASKATFEAYLKQYSVSRRSLVDVLNAEKEYFQNARQLIIASVDEVIEAYRILKLSGELHIRELADVLKGRADLPHPAEAVDLPTAILSVRRMQ